MIGKVRTAMTTKVIFETWMARIARGLNGIKMACPVRLSVIARPFGTAVRRGVRIVLIQGERRDEGVKREGNV